MTRSVSNLFATPARMAAAAVCWCAVVAACSVALVYSSRQPGAAAATPVLMPSVISTAGPERLPTMILSLHPKCPCSLATVSNAQDALSSAEGACEVVALVYRPADRARDWSHTELAKRTEGILGARIIDDVDGRIAASLGAHTSGHVVLYGPDSRLLFSGGITPGRGHEGPCAASLTLSTLLARSGPAGGGAASATVFGCSLTRPQCVEGGCGR